MGSRKIEMKEKELMSLVIDNAFPKIGDTGGVNKGKREGTPRILILMC